MSESDQNIQMWQIFLEKYADLLQKYNDQAKAAQLKIRVDDIRVK